MVVLCVCAAMDEAQLSFSGGLGLARALSTPLFAPFPIGEMMPYFLVVYGSW
jgi:hypothetical protein